jgi:SAM-dependent methyltransferase
MADYNKDWSPGAYLQQYYATPGVASDEEGIFRFVLEFFKKTNARFETMLEVGCGPTIHHALPFVPHVDRIFMADYVPGNLDEIREWVKGSSEAHNWTPYLSGVLSYESGRVPTTGEVEERIEALRDKIVGLHTCNVLSAQPLRVTPSSFDLITSFYCLECVTHTKEEWTKAMGNLSSLVRPGGWVILGAVRDTDGYKVGDVEFSTARIKEDDMHASLVANGFNPATIDVRVCQSPEWADEGFSSILVACAQKFS